MLRTTTIFSLGLTLLLAVSANSTTAETQCRAFFFRDFFLDPWQIQEAPSQPESASESDAASTQESTPVTLTTPNTAVATEAREQEITFPIWSILLLALATLLFIRGITLPLWPASGRPGAERQHTLRAKRKKLRQLQKTYRLREQTAEFRQALKEALGLPPGATDQDISRALHDCNSETMSIPNNDYHRFR